jgi:predicted nucleic acid-binding Zn ribbon protein
MSARDIALDLYNSFKTAGGGKRSIGKKVDPAIQRDSDEPKPVGELINELVKARQWQSGLNEGEIFIRWAEIVGEEIANRALPIEIRNGVLQIKCSTTSWATQLNLVKSDLLQSIKEIAPQIVDLDIAGPNGPSWRKGFRTAPGGRGPRDTYG